MGIFIFMLIVYGVCFFFILDNLARLEISYSKIEKDLNEMKKLLKNEKEYPDWLNDWK